MNLHVLQYNIGESEYNSDSLKHLNVTYIPYIFNKILSTILSSWVSI